MSLSATSPMGLHLQTLINAKMWSIQATPYMVPQWHRNPFRKKKTSDSATLKPECFFTLGWIRENLYVIYGNIVITYHNVAYYDFFPVGIVVKLGLMLDECPSVWAGCPSTTLANYWGEQVDN